MTERLMGVETEYAFTAFRKDGTPASAERAMSRIEQIARRRLPHLPDRERRGMFLENASRFYRDPGGGNAHQEMATPECPNPWDAVRYVIANERILLGLTDELLREDADLREALYFKHNVDYSGSGTSWGTHESYLTRSPILSLPQQLLPHLASRVIYTGAGGFDPFASGVRFMISPRAAHLRRAVSADTQHQRSLFNTRDEPLAGEGYRRLHVICGESLSSHTSMWLRSATTSLVVAMADAGLEPGKNVGLVDPVRAFNLFARDPSCKATAPRADGSMTTAIQIQRHLLELAEANIESEFMPPWTGSVCEHWRRILDLLEDDAPHSVSTILDWAIKHALFQDRAERRNMDWDKLQRSRRSTKTEALRQELFEIDIRFGQLGGQGVFTSLDRAGVLQHAIPGVDNIAHAMMHPPGLGRARLRGRMVRKLSGEHHQNSCDWNGVWNSKDRVWLDLSRPFETAENWKPIEENQPLNPFDDTFIFPRTNHIQQLCHHGRFEEAFQEMERVEAESPWFNNPGFTPLSGLRAFVQARRGQLDATRGLDSRLNSRRVVGERLANHILALRFFGLVPCREMPEHVREAVVRVEPENVNQLPLAYREYTGVNLTLEGRLAEAEKMLEDGITGQIGETPGINRRRAALANVKRLMGKYDEAESLLMAARDSQRNREFEGDLVDFTLPNLAKLASREDLEEAANWLSEAKRIQVRSRNRLGLVRTLLLEARLAALRGARPHSNEAILSISRKAPALGACPKFQEINDRWDQWSADPDAKVVHDVFWGI